MLFHSLQTRIRRGTRALLVAATLGAAGLTGTGTQAAAGTLSLSITPRGTQEAQVLSTAIALYALHRDLRSGADIRQTGRNHAVALQQSGPGHRGIIRQRGDGHSAMLTQQGAPNSQVILQFGRGARADVAQTGGQSGILLQFRR